VGIPLVRPHKVIHKVIQNIFIRSHDERSQHILNVSLRYVAKHLAPFNSQLQTANYDLIKNYFYRAFNAIYGKVGRLASVDVVI